MGGTSSERKVSLRSGEAVFSALKRKGYDAVCIDAAEGMESLIQKYRIDIVFLCLHGIPGEDGTVQGFLEVLGLPYTGSGVLASALAMDKIMTKQFLQVRGIPTPEFAVIEKEKDRYPGVPFPAVVKPALEGSTIGITRVEKRRELKEAVRKAFGYGSRVLIEKYIRGREVTVGILGDRPLPVIEVRPIGGFYDFSAKYTVGRTEYLVPAPISGRMTRKIQNLALSAHRLLGCRGGTRVDMMIAEGNRPLVIEVNTIPGMTETSLLPKAAREAGIPFDDLVEQILAMAVKQEGS